MGKKRRIVFAVGALAATGLAFWYAAGPDPAPAKKGPAPAVPVGLAKALVRDVPLQIELVGRTEAFESVVLKARVDGQVSSVPFVEGQHVRRGEVLVRLDPADYQARLDQARANQARSGAQLAKARADFDRATALRAKGFVSEEKVGDARTALAAAEAAARADEAAGALAQLQFSYTSIRAPFDGIVGAKQVFPGTSVKVNETALATVNRVRPLNIVFAVPEKHLAPIQAAMRAGARRMQVAVSVPGRAQALTGDVRFLDNAVDAATGTIQLKAQVGNDDEQLAPGQFVTVSLTLDTLREVIVVPAEAVQQGSQGPFLFVVGNDGLAELRHVRVTATQPKWAVLAEGVKAGETVVTEGQLRLVPGAQVRPARADKKPG